jgi:CHAD domain-containing protein
MKRASITAFARAQMRIRLNHVVIQARLATKHPGDPDAIHALRVSIRRFTQCLRTFRHLFQAGLLKRLRRRMRKLLDLCAAVRTYDVAMEVLRQAGSASPTLDSRLASARAEAEDLLRDHLKKQRHRKGSTWELTLQPAARQGSDWDPKDDLAGNLHRVLPKLADELFAMGSAAAAAGDDATALHQFRLFAKRFRYTLDLFPSFYGNELPQGLQALRGLQDRLGAINDCVSTIALIGAERGAHHLRERRAVAAIKKLLHRRETEFQVYWQREFPAEKLGWWKSWLSSPRFAA